MSENATEQQAAPVSEQSDKPKGLDALLADLDEESRKVVLGEVSKARIEAKGLRDRLKIAEPLAQQAQAVANAQKTAEQVAADKTKAAEERATVATQRAVRSEVRALAANEFADPDDAAAFLDLSSYVDINGDIDTAAITADLTALLARKPHLSKSTERRPPRPDASQASGANSKTTASPREEFASILQGLVRK